MDVKILKDPLGNVVHLSSAFDKHSIDDQAVEVDMACVIQKPTIIIRLITPAKELYHLRSVGLGVTVLLKSESTNGAWVVEDCQWNPPSKFVGELMGKGEFTFF